MNGSDFVHDFNALLAARGVEGLRAEEMAQRTAGWELVASSTAVLAGQQLAHAVRDEEIARFLACWRDGDLVISVRGPGDGSPRPLVLVRGGACFAVSGAPTNGPVAQAQPPTFAGWFQALIGAPAPIDLEFVELAPNLWGTANTAGRTIEGFPHALQIRGLRAYALAGFDGYGSNSYALYLSRVEGDTRMFLRIPWGGVYMDAEKDRPRLIEDLRAANRLFDAAAAKGLPMWLHNNMGAWHFEPRRSPRQRGASRWSSLEEVQVYVAGDTAADRAT